MSDNTSVKTTSGRSASPQSSEPTHPAVAPAVDIVESEVGITLLADMPGVAKDRLTVKVDGETLTIEGQAQIDVPENIELLHCEVRSPCFRRTFTLSRDLDPTRIEATLRDGVLQMHIPKAEQARPRRIEVQLS